MLHRILNTIYGLQGTKTGREERLYSTRTNARPRQCDLERAVLLSERYRNSGFSLRTARHILISVSDTRVIMGKG